MLKKNIYGHICLYKMHRRNDQKNQSKPFNQKKQVYAFPGIYIYSQIGSFPQVGRKIKNTWNHHLGYLYRKNKIFWRS